MSYLNLECESQTKHFFDEEMLTVFVFFPTLIKWEIVFGERIQESFYVLLPVTLSRIPFTGEW